MYKLFLFLILYFFNFLAAEQQNNPSNKKNHGLISSFPIKIRSTAKRLDNACKGFFV